MVREWIDDAIELLWRMPHTCSLDVVDEQGEYEERAATDVGWILGITRRQVNKDERRAQRKNRIARVLAALRAKRLEEGYDP